MSVRIALSESGNCDAVMFVITAAMPQPMSTPTAAGMIAPLVGMTEPTVAPRPKMDVRHHRDVAVDERQFRDVDELLGAPAVRPERRASRP